MMYRGGGKKKEKEKKTIEGRQKGRNINLPPTRFREFLI
jgi:hypothetical protein